MSRKSNALNQLFPGLSSGPPQLGEGQPFQKLLQSMNSDSKGAPPASSASTTSTTSTASTSSTHPSQGNWLSLSSPGSLGTLEQVKIALYNARVEEGELVNRGRQVGSSYPYLVYCLRDGSARVIHTPTVLSVLLKHQGIVKDVKFSPRLSNLVGTVGADGFAVVWELRHDDASKAVQFRETLRLYATDCEAFTWHPMSERTFTVTHGEVVSFVQLTSALWAKQQEAGAEGLPLEDVRFAFVNCPAQVNWSCFGAQAHIFATGCNDGSIIGWDVSPILKDSPSQTINKLWSVSTGGAPVSYVSFIQNDLMVSAEVKDGTQLRVWSLSAQSSPAQTYQVHIGNKDVRMSFDTHSSGQYLFVAPSTVNQLICLKLTGQSLGQAVYFDLECPIVSMTCRATESTETLLCHQTKSVQALTFKSDSFETAENIVRPSTAESKSMPERQTSSLVSPAQFLGRTDSAGSVGSIPATPGAAVDSTQEVVPKAVPLESATATGGLEALLQTHFDAMTAKLQKDAEARAAKDLERQKNLLAVLSKSLNEVSENVDDAVRDALESEEVVSALSKAFAEQLSGSIASAIAQALDDSGPASLTSKVAESMRKPISHAFVETFRDNLVPAFQAGCNNMIAQFQGAAAGMSSSSSNKGNSEIKSLAKTLNEVQLAVKKLSDSQIELQHSLRLIQQSMGNGNVGTRPVSSSSSSTPNQYPTPQHPRWPRIAEELARGDFNEALTIALSEGNLPLVVDTCKRIKCDQVFNPPLKLSHPVLLSVLQQLSTDLLSDTQLKLEWIQRSAMAINQNDVSISVHFHHIMQTVVSQMKENRSQIPETSPLRPIFDLCYNIVESRATGY